MDVGADFVAVWGKNCISSVDPIYRRIRLYGRYRNDAGCGSSMAEGFYGAPEELKQQCRERLPEDLRKVLRQFEKTLHS